MLSSGIFPSRLRLSEIKTLFKKGDKSNVSNYRPISILTSFSTIFKKLMFTRLIQHQKYKQILTEEQSLELNILLIQPLINYSMASLHR
jgi:hypothetical protein